MRRNLSTLVRSLAITAIALVTLPALALEPVNKDGKGLAVHGYDVVTYFTDGKPVKGGTGITHQWNGATWLFASKEHRDAFAADPERFAPQYGGYCAKAVSEDQTADIDPEAWKIVDGKLYLNYSLKVRRLWEEDIPGRIKRADANWPGLLAEDR